MSSLAPGQPDLFGPTPTVDVRSVGPAGPPLPPSQGRTPQTRHTSLSGAIAALPRAQSQKARMLMLYLDRGPSSDGDIALQMGLPEGRISARRSALLADGIVQACDIVMGPYKAEVTRWCLTVKGVHVAGALRKQPR